MRPRYLLCLAIVAAGLFSGCAGVERRPAEGAAGGAPQQVERSDRAELAQELSLYSD